MKTRLTYHRGSYLLETIMALTVSVIILGILYLVSASHIRAREHVDKQLMLAEHTLLLYHLIDKIMRCDTHIISPETIGYHCQPDVRGSLRVDNKQCALFDQSDKTTKARKRLSHICTWSLHQDKYRLTIHAQICTDLSACIHPTLRFAR